MGRLGTGRIAAGFCLLIVSLLLACDGAPASPSGLALRVEVVSGDGQSGLAGRTLPQPIVIQVLDADDRPVNGIRVQFEVLEGGGTVRPASSLSFALGKAAADWQLGGVDFRTQTLVARLRDGDRSASATVGATALGPHETDIVVFRNATGPIRGVLILGEDRFGILQIHQTVLPSDTIVPLQPIENEEMAVLVFPSGNLPNLTRVSWTAGIDTAYVDLQQPFRLRVTFNVYEGPFDERMAVINEHMVQAQKVWADEGMGLTFGEVKYADRTAGNPLVNRNIPEDCGPPLSGTEILVDYIHLVGGGIIAGHGCRDQVMMGVNSAEFPLLLAQEFGPYLCSSTFFDRSHG